MTEMTPRIYSGPPLASSVPDMTVPYDKFYIRMMGWQPGNRWRVLKFHVR